MHVAQSIVNLFVKCIKDRPTDQQQIVRYIAIAKGHDIEIVGRKIAKKPAPPASTA